MDKSLDKTRVTVLIADDHPVFREGLRNVVESEEGFQVVAQAGRGDTAVTEARRWRPDVMLVDVNMPTLDGLQVVRLVRAELPGTKLILLTAFHDEEQMIRAYRMGASAYFPKDVDPGALLYAIRHVLEGGYVVMGSVMTADELRRWIASRLITVAPLGSPPEDVYLPLTWREMEVLQNLADGSSNKEIARKLAISEQTVKNHVSSVLRKLNVADRTQAAMHAVRQGWVRVHDLHPG